jgi:hypothetical protein
VDDGLGHGHDPAIDGGPKNGLELSERRLVLRDPAQIVLIEIEQ